MEKFDHYIGLASVYHCRFTVEPAILSGSHLEDIILVLSINQEEQLLSVPILLNDRRTLSLSFFVYWFSFRH